MTWLFYMMYNFNQGFYSHLNIYQRTYIELNKDGKSKRRHIRPVKWFPCVPRAWIWSTFVRWCSLSVIKFHWAAAILACVKPKKALWEEKLLVHSWKIHSSRDRGLKHNNLLDSGILLLDLGLRLGCKRFHWIPKKHSYFQDVHVGGCRHSSGVAV